MGTKLRKKKKDKKRWTPSAQNKGNEIKGLQKRMDIELMEIFPLEEEQYLGVCGFETEEGECLCYDGYCWEHEWCEHKL